MYLEVFGFNLYSYITVHYVQLSDIRKIHPFFNLNLMYAIKAKSRVHIMFNNHTLFLCILYNSILIAYADI